MSTVADVADKFRAELLAGDRAAADRIIARYGQAWLGIRNQLGVLTVQMEEALARGEVVNPSWLYRQERLANVLRVTEREIALAARSASVTAQAAQAEAVEAAMAQAPRLLSEVSSDLIGYTFGEINPDVALQMVGHTANGSPLADLFAPLGPDASRTVEQKLVEGVLLGRNPRAIAPGIRDALGGNLHRALTIARTEALRAYRETSRMTYEANADVLEGWVWSCATTTRTCAVCWAMNGTLHPLSESLGSHPSCRCAMLPHRFGRRRPPLGEDQFSRLPERDQFAILGPGKFDAYKRGDLRLGDLVERVDDPRWGITRRERSLARIRAAKRRPTTNAQVQELLADSVTQAQRDTLEDYMTVGFAEVNLYHRAPHMLPNAERSRRYVTEATAQIDDVVNKAELVEDVEVYRIVRHPNFLPGRGKRGMEWTDEAFVSTTRDSRTLAELVDPKSKNTIFAPGEERDAVIIQLRLKAGDKAAYLDAIHPPNPSRSIVDQKEVLLPRGLRYRIVGEDVIFLGDRPVTSYIVEIVR